MRQNSYFIKLNDIKVLELELNENNKKMIFALNLSGVGYFEYNSLHKTLYISKLMKEVFEVDCLKEFTLFDLINTVHSNNDLLQLFGKAKGVLEGNSQLERTLSFTINGHVSWYEFMVNKVDHFLVGTMKNLDGILPLKASIEEESNPLNQVFKSIPLPLYYYDGGGHILYTNRKYNEDMSTLHKIIEKHTNGEKNVFKKYNWITFFEMKVCHNGLMKYEVHYELNQEKHINIIHRVTMDGDSYEPAILFIHEDASDIHLDDSQLTKILKANELIIEVKDLVDHVSDLNSMYDYLLSKIHTVVPSAKRACIIKLNKKSEMYLTASYGFSEEYVNGVKLPFDKSFANSSLRGDYSKSIVLNDIQDKYAKIYPDINNDQDGFTFESNMTAPLVIDGVLYGMLSVDSDKNHVFDNVDLNLFDYLKLQIERAIVKFQKFSIVKQNSILDPLTGIFNRRHLLEKFEQFCEEATQSNKTFAFVLFDLDKLKLINDNYGHVMGDKVIQQFSFIASNEIREIDVMARIGGDEFVGLFRNIEVDVLIEKIKRWQDVLTAHTNESENGSITTQFSYGISLYPSEGQNFEELMDVSDKKMYLQKRGKEDL